MHGQLLIRKRDEQTLDQFVSAITKIIGPLKWLERQSSNYIDERYFSATVLALEITAAIADDSEFSGYEFWLSIATGDVTSDDKLFLDGVADIVARALSLYGYEVLHPNDMSRSGRGGTIYRLNPEPNSKPRERVIVETI